MPLKSSPSQLKRLAAVLRKTLKDLEASEKPEDHAFITMKAQMMLRILDLEVQAARARSGLHLVESQIEEEGQVPADPKAESIA